MNITAHSLRRGEGRAQAKLVLLRGGHRGVREGSAHMIVISRVKNNITYVYHYYY